MSTTNGTPTLPLNPRGKANLQALFEQATAEQMRTQGKIEKDYCTNLVKRRMSFYPENQRQQITNDFAFYAAKKETLRKKIQQEVSATPPQPTPTVTEGMQQSMFTAAELAKNLLRVCEGDKGKAKGYIDVVHMIMN